jgi:tRNA (guanosine-2'-O-)-methyltransferase
MQENDEALTSYLAGFVTDRRKQRLQDILAERMRHMCVVLEDVYQAHNASAVLRSCDCFGVQDIHFIENKHKFKISEEVSMGSTQWLTIKKYNSEEKNNTKHCLQELKNKGYRIVATTPHKNDTTIAELDITKPFALVFGTEITGITEDVMEMADDFVKIPMYGFTESFNISVSAALCMYELTTRIRKSGINYKLSEKEKEEIYFDWIKASINKVDLIIQDYNSKKS